MTGCEIIAGCSWCSGPCCCPACRDSGSSLCRRCRAPVRASTRPSCRPSSCLCSRVPPDVDWDQRQGGGRVPDNPAFPRRRVLRQSPATQEVIMTERSRVEKLLTDTYAARKRGDLDAVCACFADN